ncbi:hypothetical protein ERX46_00515 [Brumimicrobium glaciale]|uniref:Uncharacterized protein n=1 Tax=Brumimicrobium glaciale TaxID=200475 RepID=A0A4Q4KTS5_9FLAO|nr:hypothetical protein [Brumimicrobium glaciale]RYM35504.1 hypothetical protein ERX46_00515 [Brumimicrobium glaciale]
MKRIVLIIFCIVGCHCLSQNAPCLNNVSTDPKAPSNTNLPNDIHPVVSYDLLFLNNFNWIPFSPAGGLSDLQTSDLPGLGSSQVMRSLYDNATGTDPFYQYINDEVIMPTNGIGGFIPNHQNGWELLGVNLGFFPNGTKFLDVDGESNKYPTMPYVILYQRYLGKIRVFVNIQEEWAQHNAYDAARIRLTLNNSEGMELNGLFRLQNGIDQSLDQSTVVRSIGALAASPNDS